MKRKRHTPQQIVRKLQEAKAVLVAGRELVVEVKTKQTKAGEKEYR